LEFKRDPLAVGLAYDGRHHQIFWTTIEEGQQSIRFAHLHQPGTDDDHEDGRVPHILLSDRDRVPNPEGLAFDQLGGNLYFTNMDRRSVDSFVGVIKIDEAKEPTWIKLITQDVEKPRGIAVVPEAGLLFYADWGTTPALVRAGMDGSQVRRIVTRGIQWINGVTVDAGARRVYWTDAQFDRIETVDFEGHHRR
jgi:DNA-binding beta-propeller fold protein YncE